jgi:hypothetical protein
VSDLGPSFEQIELLGELTDQAASLVRHIDTTAGLGEPRERSCLVAGTIEWRRTVPAVGEWALNLR